MLCCEVGLALLCVGAYTDSLGLSRIRQQVADFISRRDGYEARKEDVILINGASEGILVRLYRFQVISYSNSSSMECDLYSVIGERPAM